MSLYGNLVKTADRLIKSKGVSGTLTRDVAAAFDPVVGQDASATTQAISVTCVIKRLSRGYDKTDAAVKASTHEAIISGANPSTGAALAFNPVAGNNLTVSGEVWKINAVEEVQPGGTIVIYKALVSR